MKQKLSSLLAKVRVKYEKDMMEVLEIDELFEKIEE